jgi:hypothetical protein
MDPVGGEKLARITPSGLDAWLLEGIMNVNTLRESVVNWAYNFGDMAIELISWDLAIPL